MTVIEPNPMRRIEPDEIVSGYPVFNDPANAVEFCKREHNQGNAIAFVSTLSVFLMNSDNRAIVVNSRINKTGHK